MTKSNLLVWLCAHRIFAVVVIVVVSRWSHTFNGMIQNLIERLSEHKWCALLFWRFNARAPNEMEWNGCAKVSVYPFVMCHSIRSVTYVQSIEQIQSNEQTIDLSAGSITTLTYQKHTSRQQPVKNMGWYRSIDLKSQFHLLFDKWKSAADNGSQSADR